MLVYRGDRVGLWYVMGNKYEGGLGEGSGGNEKKKKMWGEVVGGKS